MRKPGTAIGAALVLAMVAGTARAEWQNTLKPSGPAGQELKVAEAGRPTCSICCPAQASGPEKKAAEDLQHWLAEITGAKLAIVSGVAPPKSIAIGTDPALGDEGYAITAADSGLTLSGGKTRGPINAVYALLEEDLGCRFYTNESIRLPKSPTLTIAPVPRRYVPRLKLRDPYYAAAFDPVWSLRNRTNAPLSKVPEEYGGHVDYAGMFVHTAAQMVPDSLFAAHPEYFAQGPDGKRGTAQLCATEPEVHRLALEYVRRVLKDNPHTEILSVSKNDNMTMCHCPRCAQLRDAEGSDMANQLLLVNHVAEAIEAEHPNVVIDTLAYLETIQVPKTARPRKNVAIRICNDSVGAWSQPFTPAERCKVAKIAKAWSQVHDRLYVWDYTVNFSHYLAPMPNLDFIAANIRFWVDNHAEGVMLQGGYQGPAERDELKCWVSSKLLWDPKRDERALAADFIWGHYGAAAPPLAEYEALLEKAAADHAAQMASPAGGIRYPMDAAFISKEFVTTAVQLFERAGQLAAGDEALLRRVERAKLPVLYVQCVRGPDFVGQDYAAVVGEFERIARREKVRYLQEGGSDFEGKLAGYKGRIPKPASQPAGQ